MNKTFTTGVILGVCAAIAILAGYFTISTIDTVSADHAVIAQIVTLINNSQKQTTSAPTANIAPTGK